MKKHREQKSEGMNEKKEEVKMQPSIQSGDEEIVIIDSGGIPDISIKWASLTCSSYGILISIIWV